MSRKVTSIFVIISILISSIDGMIYRTPRITSYLSGNQALKSNTLKLQSVLSDLLSTSSKSNQNVGLRGMSATKNTEDGLVNGVKPVEDSKGFTSEAPIHDFPVFPLQIHSPVDAPTLFTKTAADLNAKPQTIEETIEGVIKSIQTFGSRNRYYTPSIKRYMDKVLDDLNSLQKLEPSTLLGNGQRVHLEPSKLTTDKDLIQTGLTAQSRQKLRSIQSTANDIAKSLKAAMVEIQRFPEDKITLFMKRKPFYISQDFSIMDVLIEKNLISQTDALNWFRDGDMIETFAKHTSIKSGKFPTDHWLPTKASFLEHHPELRASLSVLEDSDWKKFSYQTLSYVDDFLDKGNGGELLQISKAFKSPEFYNGLETGSEAFKNTLRNLLDILDDPKPYHFLDESTMVTESMFMNRHLSYIRTYANPNVLGEYSSLKSGLIGTKLDSITNINQLLTLSEEYDKLLAWEYTKFIKMGTQRQKELYELDVPEEHFLRSFASTAEIEEWRVAVVNGIGKDELFRSKYRKNPRLVKLEDQINENFKEFSKVLSDGLSPNRRGDKEINELKVWLKLQKQAEFLNLMKTRVLNLDDHVKFIQKLQA